ncbi:MAG: hypothetical protein MPW13_02730 [Candidatus Manganitrophus sp.]|nr:hypothetical protein [Candidatus Manganitrophus sp.]
MVSQRSVAGLIRWSLQAAKREFVGGSEKKVPNARFIILDPNGEYRKAFEDMTDQCRVFRPGDDINPFILPAWMWNSYEWGAVTYAQPGSQRPHLVRALRNLRAGKTAWEPLHVTIVRQLRLYRSKLHVFLADGTGASYSGFPAVKNCADTIRHLADVIKEYEQRISDTSQKAALQKIITAAEALFAKRVTPNTKTPGKFNYTDFNALDFEPFMPLFSAAEGTFPPVADDAQISEDAPIPFDINQLADHIDDLCADSASSTNLIAFLTLRIRSMLADLRMRQVIAPEEPLEFHKWLESFIGANEAENGQIAIIDLSLVPSDVTHIVVAVLARLVFESLQRYHNHHEDGKPLPTVLVLEEAHTFVRHVGNNESWSESSANLCCEAFERVAREGRKFGLGLVLSSQRPSELSSTVLAQCNTFLLHRIVNDADQKLISHLVPDNLGGLLRELPSLPSRHAILLGWATPIPILAEIDELPKQHRPQSADPDFWEVWTGADARPVDWSKITKDWVGEIS